jgi:hypothetical protein
MADLQAARADGGTKKISLKSVTVDMAIVLGQPRNRSYQ